VLDSHLIARPLVGVARPLGVLGAPPEIVSFQGMAGEGKGGQHLSS
jgi:hypothetical protein